MVVFVVCCFVIFPHISDVDTNCSSLYNLRILKVHMLLTLMEKSKTHRLTKNTRTGFENVKFFCLLCTCAHELKVTILFKEFSMFEFVFLPLHVQLK